MYGWTGKILKIDLESRQTEVITLSQDIYSSFVGGKGLGGYFLAQAANYAWDHPQMPVMLLTGPLVGTMAPTSGRMTIMSRSPLTGTVGDTSVGGRLGVRIKRAGYDAIILVGKSATPVGVEITDVKIEFKDASAFIGQTVPCITRSIEFDGSVALTGPAADNGVLFASVIVDKHYAAARGGIGLCFAEKNLKYVGVNGTGDVQVKDEAELRRAREDVFRLAAASSVLMGENGITNLGTPALYDLMHARRMMPTDNFRKTYFPHAPSLNATALRSTYKTKRFGCHGCHILCKKRGAQGVAIPEFETLSHFTALLENTDLQVAVTANELCNAYGMDTISTAVTLACYAEIEDSKLDGETICRLVTDMALATGEGELLSQGSARYARIKKRPETSMSVKGLELPAYDPRGAYGMALAYATSTRGGCHLRAYPIGHEILRKPVATNRFSFNGKARIIKISEDKNALIDSLTACKFVFFASSFEEYARAFAAVTGVPMTATDLSLIGERIYYNDRMLNARWGFEGKDDELPDRFFKEAGTDGPGFKVPAIDRQEFLEAKKRYYHVRGLDENGRPLRAMAEKLGLKWIS